MPSEPEERIQQAVNEVVSRVEDTFPLSLTKEQFVALASVMAWSVIAEIKDDAIRAVHQAKGPQRDPAGAHLYRSTACLHRQHAYCASTIGHNADSGDSWRKTPASCKFCAAPCDCLCHVDKSDREALRSWMGAHRDPDRDYPGTSEDFARRQQEKLMDMLARNNEEDPPDRDLPDGSPDQG